MVTRAPDTRQLIVASEKHRSQKGNLEECFEKLKLLVGDVLEGRGERAEATIRYAAGFLSSVASVNDGRTAPGTKR